MAPTDHNHSERLSPTEAVAHMLSYTGQMIGDKGRDYVQLGIELETYLHDRGDVRAWETFDVAEFVRSTANGRRNTIIRCCDLAALLSWVSGFGGIRKIDMAKHYDVLAEICPADAAARAYIRWGGRRARGFEDDPPIEVLRRPRPDAN